MIQWRLLCAGVSLRLFVFGCAALLQLGPLGPLGEHCRTGAEIRRKSVSQFEHGRSVVKVVGLGDGNFNQRGGIGV